MKGKFTRTPSDIIFKINALLQRWQKLLRKDDRGALEVMVSQIRGWVEEFQEKLKDCPPDDVFFVVLLRCSSGLALVASVFYLCRFFPFLGRSLYQQGLPSFSESVLN